MRCLLKAEAYVRRFDRYMSQSSNKETEPPGNTYIRRDLLQGFGSAQLWGLVKQYVKAVAFVLGAEA